MRRWRAGAGLALVAAAALAACGGGAPSADTVAPGAPTTSPGVNAGSPPEVQKAASVDACAVLTPAEIQQLLGAVPNPGASQTFSEGGAFHSCTWQAPVPPGAPRSASLTLVFNLKSGFLTTESTTAGDRSVAVGGAVGRFSPASRQLAVQRGDVLLTLTAAHLPSTSAGQLQAILRADAATVLGSGL